MDPRIVQPWSWSERARSRGALIALVAGQAALLGHAEARLSPTLDEPAHVVAGLSWWWEGDSRLNFANPPLGHVLQTAPAALLAPRVPFSERKGWQASDVDGLTRDFDRDDYPAARAALRWSRFGTILVSIALTLYVHARVRRWFGERIALASAAALVFNPLMLAHGGLVTLDLPVTLGIVLASGELAAYLERPGRRQVTLLGLAVGAACSIKFNALFLVPLTLGAIVLAAALGLAGFSGMSGRRRALGACAHLAAIALLTLLVIDASYLFQRTGWTTARLVAETPPVATLAAEGPTTLLERLPALAWLPGGLPVPLPYSYLVGLGSVNHQVLQHGHRLPQYFLGELANRSWWYYFPLLLLVKSPLLWVLCALASGVAAIRALGRLRWPGRPGEAPPGRVDPPRVAALVLAATGLTYLALLMTARLNIGVRHALPLVPVVTVLGTAVLLAERSGRSWQAGYALLLAAAIGSCWRAHPFYLGYFSPLAGGAERERTISVLGEDWGQDVRAAGLVLRELAPDQLYYAGNGHTAGLELAALGLRPRALGCKRPPGTGAAPTGPPARGGTWVAVHDALFVRKRGCYAWLPDAPDRWVNNHVRLYRLAP